MMSTAGRDMKQHGRAVFPITKSHHPSASANPSGWCFLSMDLIPAQCSGEKLQEVDTSTMIQDGGWGVERKGLTCF